MNDTHTKIESETSRQLAAAKDLAELVINMGMVTTNGLLARDLARRVLGIERLHRDGIYADNIVPITTNGRTRYVPKEEPVFLLRGQDMLAPATVRFWADAAELHGASERIVSLARADATAMEAWPKKKLPDHPSEKGE